MGGIKQAVDGSTGLEAGSSDPGAEQVAGLWVRPALLEVLVAEDGVDGFGCTSDLQAWSTDPGAEGVAGLWKGLALDESDGFGILGLFDGGDQILLGALGLGAVFAGAADRKGATSGGDGLGELGACSVRGVACVAVVRVCLGKSRGGDGGDGHDGHEKNGSDLHTEEEKVDLLFEEDQGVLYEFGVAKDGFRSE